MATVSLQAAYDQARRLLEGGDTERAIAVAQHILSFYPRNLEAQRILGEAFLASRHPEQAQASFQTVIHADPENIPAYVGLGISHERQGRGDQAIAAFEHALEIKPDMPELRSQLLRLYTDTWGSESAQLRLSRSGLARLYAKGHMLPQAVQEFRSVIAEQPDRYDARVGLAEVLWRNGQDDAAITACEDILAEHPDTLKANLLLGYLLLSSGDERGKQYWEAAQAIDPYNTVANALFDQLPESAPEPTLPAWDEQRWLAERADQERAAREQEAARQPAPEPAVAVVAPAAPAASLDDELFGSSWMSAIDTPTAPSSPAEPVAEGPPDDDFLASLLSFDDPAVPNDPHATARLTPFSLDDVEPAAPAAPQPVEATPLAEEAPAAPTQASAEEPALAPFSLSELGLSDDEIAGLDSLGEQPQPEEPAPAPAVEEEPTLTPFSFSDLGLSDDEIASLDSLGEQPQPEEPAPAPVVEEEPTLTPFSFSDLGLSEEEIASLDSLGAEPAAQTQTEAPAPAPAPAAAEEEEPTLTPFSLSDLGLSEEEIASLDSLGAEPAAQTQTEAPAPAPAPAAAEEEEPTLTPFSLSDLGLSEEEIASLDNVGAQQGAPAASADAPDLDEDLAPFSLGDLGLGDDDSANVTAQPAAQQRSQAQPTSTDEEADLDAELMPFSLDDLDINAGSGADLGLGSLPTSLQPFSLDDIGEAPPAPATAQAPLSAPEDDEPAAENAAYSWEVPPSKPNTDFLRDAPKSEQPAGASIFSKLRQRHSELPPVEAPPLPPVADDETDMSLFSHDDISLRDDAEIGHPAATVETTPLAPSAAPAETADSGEPEMTPFSLADLGLSPDEIASLGLDDASSASPDAAELDLAPFSLDDLGMDSPDTFNADNVTTELKLSDEELEGMDMGSLGAAVSEPTSAVDTGDPALDNLITLGQRQGFVDLTDIIAAVENPEEESDRIEEIGLVLHRAGIEIRDGDEVIDMDEEVDAIEPFDDTEASFAFSDEAVTVSPAAPVASDEPEMTPFSLADLGLSPEEIASLGLEEPTATEEPAAAPEPVATSEPEAPQAPATSDEPDMTPFSLADLGLSAEEIAALGLEDPTAAEEPAAAPEPVAASEPEAPQAPATSDEPDMTPFSLADLGLSAEEIAALGLEEPTAAEEPAAAPEPVETSEPEAPQAPATSDEPDMTPFSLADLGLSAEEIAALGLEEPTAAEEPAAAPEPVAASEPEAPQAPATSDEPDMTPFSLADLGLSAEEIAALGLEEPTAAEAAAAEEPVAASAPEEPAASQPPVAEEPAAAPEPVATSEPEAPQAPTTSDEPDMTPFSLADLGLSAEEIAAFELEQGSESAASANAPTASAGASDSGDQDMTPFSLSDLGLTAEEIDALDLPNVEPPAETPAAAPSAEAEADEFDFSAIEAQLGQSGPVRAQPGQPRPPREEEPPPPVSPEDQAFAPEPLDALDTVWPALAAPQPMAKAEPPAAAAPPPTPPAPARTSTIERLPPRGEAPPRREEPPRREATPRREEPPRREAPARREEPPRREAPARREEPRTAASSAPAARTVSWKARQQQTFLPTGDEQLDTFLNQLDSEPANDRLRLAVARAGGKSGRLDLALYQYKTLIRDGNDLDDVVGDIQDLIDEHEEARDLQRLYRLLGDAFSKQNRFRDAVEAYSWTFGK